MNRDALRVAVLAVVCILAVVVGAATLDSPTRVQSGGTGAGGGDGIGGGGGDSIDTGGDSESFGVDIFQQSGGIVRPRICVSLLSNPLVQGGLVAAFAVGWLVLRQRTDAFAASAMAAAVAIPAVLLYALLTSCQDREKVEAGAPEVLTNGSTGGGSGGAGILGEAVAVQPTELPPVVFVVAGAALLVALAAVFRDGGGDFSEMLAPVRTDDGGDEDDEDDVTAARAAVGAAAGRAADRIETGVDVENEVYRAWQEMTDPLAVDRPHSSTPGEFAAAAVEAGMDREDVTELTRLFEEVRYGGYDADAERERRAVEALRRIEAEYADAGAEGGAVDGRRGSGAGGRPNRDGRDRWRLGDDDAGDDRDADDDDDGGGWP